MGTCLQSGPTSFSSLFSVQQPYTLLRHNKLINTFLLYIIYNTFKALFPTTKCALISTNDSAAAQMYAGTVACRHFGAIQVLRNAFSWKFDLHPPPRNANNVEPYTFVTLFSRKPDTLYCIT